MGGHLQCPCHMGVPKLWAVLRSLLGMAAVWFTCLPTEQHRLFWTQYGASAYGTVFSAFTLAFTLWSTSPEISAWPKVFELG